MQNAKDTFYVALRDRLQLLNPLRSLVIRAVQRPGMLVEEAEAPMARVLSDAFSLRWTSLAIAKSLPNPMTSMGCEIEYTTSGTQATFGLDRGRTMAEMDRELIKILSPMCAQKVNYATSPIQDLQTQVFWTEPVFGTLGIQRNQLSRIASLQVLSFQDSGEL